jgi:ADP-ribosylglycohydrolase
MLGAIAGDIIGSVYEHSPIKTREFPLFGPQCRFTDDTVLSLAVARAILTGGGYRENLLELGRCYPEAGYGGGFRRWLRARDPQPYHSWGNGAAMRVSPIGFAFDSEDRVLAEARASAAVTHDHPEGIKGAEAVALAVFLARKGGGREEIRRRIGDRFGYDLKTNLDAIRPAYRFDVSCQGTVPPAIVAFLEAPSWEESVRNAVSLGGDSDTLACITGAIAEAHFGGVPVPVRERALAFLPEDLRAIAEEFEASYAPGGSRF